MEKGGYEVDIIMTDRAACIKLLQIRTKQCDELMANLTQGAKPAAGLKPKG